VNGSNRAVRAGMAIAVLMCGVGTDPIAAEDPAIKLRISIVGANEPPLTIELLRWSADGERAPLLAALAPPPAAPPAAAAPAAGRGGRGGRGAAAPPLTPAARLTAAIKAAPTLGFIWGDGPTGYSIKYAWRSALPDGRERIVLATDRRLGAHSTSWTPPSGGPADAEFTVMDMRIDGKGAGEVKTSHTSPVVIDAGAKTLALDRYEAAPVLLKVTR
jgi:hypothetical protein